MMEHGDEEEMCKNEPIAPLSCGVIGVNRQGDGLRFRRTQRFVGLAGRAARLEVHLLARGVWPGPGTSGLAGGMSPSGWPGCCVREPPGASCYSSRGQE